MKTLRNIIPLPYVDGLSLSLPHCFNKIQRQCRRKGSQLIFPVFTARLERPSEAFPG
jgi:hypothetical protein